MGKRILVITMWIVLIFGIAAPNIVFAELYGAGVSDIQQFPYMNQGIAYAYQYGEELRIVTPSKTIKTPKLYPMLGDVIANDDGYIYVVWGKPNIGGRMGDPNMFISKYRPDGTLDTTASFAVDAKVPFSGGNCSSAIGNGVLMVHYGRQLYNGHQSSDVICINTSSMTSTMLGNVPFISHSFDQSVIWSKLANDFVFADEGDARPRGFVISSLTKAQIVPFHFYLPIDQYFIQDSTALNGVYAQFGNISETSKGVALVGSSVKSIGENANLERNNLFVQLFDPRTGDVDASNVACENRSGKTGMLTSSDIVGITVTDIGVHWLTDYTDKHVIASQVVTADDKLVILWTTQTQGTTQIELHYMELSASGDVITPATSLGNLLLNSAERPVYYNGSIFWATSSYNDLPQVWELSLAKHKIVSINAPTALTLTNVNDTTLNLSWTPTIGVAGYDIYRSTSPDADFVKIATLDSQAANSYQDTGLIMNSNYYYKLKSYHIVDGERVYSAFSSLTSGKTLPETPPDFKVSPYNYDTIMLVWKPVATATGYEIHRSTSSGTDFVKIATLVGKSVNTYLNSDLNKDITYYYKIRTYITVNGEQIFGDFSTPIYSKSVLTPPLDLRISNVNYNTLNFSWSPVPGASGYEVYRSKLTTTNFVKIKTLAGQSVVNFQDTGLNTDILYYYRVVAYREDNGVITRSQFYSSLVSGTPVMSSPKGITLSNINENTLNLSWTTLDEATGYEIYRAIAFSTNYVKIATVEGQSTNNFKNTDLLTNTVYYYKIKSYRTVNGVQSFSNYSLPVSAKPLPSGPTGLSLSSINSNTLKLSWTPLDSALAYQVYRSTSQEAGFVKVATLEGQSASSYQSTGLVANTVYYYKVKANCFANDGYGESTFSSVVSAKTAPIVLSVPTDLIVASSDSNTLKLTWATVENATGYEIYRSTSQEADFVKIATLDGQAVTTYQNTGLKASTVYYFKVRAISVSNGDTTYSTNTAVVSAKTMPIVPSVPTDLIVAGIDFNSLKLTWATVENATGYEIYQSTSQEADFVKITTLDGQSVATYQNIGLKASMVYYFKIRAICASNGDMTYSTDTAVVSAKTAPIVPSVPTDLVVAGIESNTLKLTWATVVNATGYEVYRSTSQEVDFVKIATLDGQSVSTYQNTGLKASTAYYFKIRAICASNGDTTYSTDTAVISAKTVPIVPSVPTGLILTGIHYNSVKLSWKTVPGTDSYEVYRSTSKDIGFVKIATLVGQSVNSFQSTDLVTSKVYYYKIRAICASNGDTTYSAYTSVVSAKTVLPAPTGLVLSKPTKTSVKAVWSAVSGASGYEVSLGKSLAGPFTVLSNTVVSYYTKPGLVSGAKYYIRVRAYRIIGVEKIYSKYSEVKLLKR